jgi:endonuclease/exonuclease/phosphatase family metal-dependent hydrolase
VRFLLYNIRYGTGGKRTWFPWGGYLGRTQENLDEIIRFICSLDPDIVGLVEVDAGSYRAGKRNQAETIADAMGHYHTYQSKYSQSGLLRLLPVLNKQGNAFVTRDTIRDEQFHYFDKGAKRLVIELDLQHLTIFLVHLSLTFRVRHHQLSDLYSLVKGAKKPHIVAGDFNSRWGDREIRLFLAATGLNNACRSGEASYPSWAPRRRLDFILHSPQINVKTHWLPRVMYSDHLPVVCDFEIQ